MQRISFSLLKLCWQLINASVTAVVVLAVTVASGQATPGQDKIPPLGAAARVLRLDLFVRPDSELCAHAISIADEFCKSRGGVELVVHDVVADRAALDQYWKLAARFRVEKPVLPAFYACHRLKIGFAEKEGDSGLAELFAIHAYVRPGCQHYRDAIITLSHRKMREDEGRWLKLLSGVVVLALGAVVLFKPEWLQWGGGHLRLGLGRSQLCCRKERSSGIAL